jgi:hypothetical protein
MLLSIADRRVAAFEHASLSASTLPTMLRIRVRPTPHPSSTHLLSTLLPLVVFPSPPTSPQPTWCYSLSLMRSTVMSMQHMVLRVMPRLNAASDATHSVDVCGQQGRSPHKPLYMPLQQVRLDSSGGLMNKGYDNDQGNCSQLAGG